MNTIFSEPDPLEQYDCLPGVQATNQTKLIKWVLLSKTCEDIIPNIKNLIETDPASLNKADSIGCTPLIVACGNSVPIKVIKLLLDSHADVTLTCGFGRTALMIAAYFGNYEAAELLVSNGIDTQDTHGYTALIIAVMQGHQSVCELLIKAGCNIKSTNGETALKFASINKNQDLYNMLVAAGAEETVCASIPKTKTLRVKYGDILIEREIDFELDDKQLEKIMEILITYAK